MGDPFLTEKQKVKCAVFVPVVDANSDTPCTNASAPLGHQNNRLRTPDAQLEEALGLAEAIDLDVLCTDISKIATIHPATLYGSGKVEDLGAMISTNKIDVTIVDHPLTPVQQRNLERAWNTKVLDRTGIILEIFGARAQTKEGKLQVDLAALRYQRGRLVRSWTHLERQRGGAGFLGGPGETQIEADRRALQTKIERLERQLDQVRKTRSLHRKQRKRNEIPVIAFVGYTNAGKSTLFNRITNARVFAKDLLFATLDPTLRKITLPEETEAIMSDTVGFVSNLPTDLIAAFRATLEEITEADIILHVRDISHADSEAQADDVKSVLFDLGVDIENIEQLQNDNRQYLEVWNKTDLLEPSVLEDLKSAVERRADKDVLLCTAKTGEGIDAVLQHIEGLLNTGHTTRCVTLSGSELGNLHYAYSLGTVLDRQETKTGEVHLKIRSNKWGELSKYMTVQGDP